MKETNSKWKQVILEYLKVIVVTVVLTYSLLYFIQISRVDGISMSPTYHTGNIVLVDKRFYHYDDCQYGDIVVAKVDFGQGEEQIIKRVIGKSGDKIACHQGVIYRNDKKLNETYINEHMNDQDWEVTVGKGDVFIMGDNRNHSSDSRILGSLSFERDIVGKVFFKVL